jgi:hypothetical protein
MILFYFCLFFEAYILDMKIYPFSLTIFYPSLDKKEKFGRTPVYVKIIPRGDISQIRSDYSAIELMMVVNFEFLSKKDLLKADILYQKLVNKIYFKF